MIHHLTLAFNPKKQNSRWHQ